MENYYIIDEAPLEISEVNANTDNKYKNIILILSILLILYIIIIHIIIMSKI